MKRPQMVNLELEDLPDTHSCTLKYIEELESTLLKPAEGGTAEVVSSLESVAKNLSHFLGYSLQLEDLVTPDQDMLKEVNETLWECIEALKKI